MSARNRAREHDSADRPLAALEAYEVALASDDSDLETLLDLSVLYFECCDGGYLAYHRLPSDLVHMALDRAKAILAEAERRFGGNNEIDFWRHYFDFYSLGSELDPGECEKIARRGPSLVPFFHLFATPGGERYAGEARALWEQVRHGRTARERHIRSVLESSVNDQKWGGTGRPL